MSDKNEKVEINLNDFDINKASFQLLLEVAARLRMISNDISIIRFVSINGTDDLQENIKEEKLQRIEDFKKTQFEILAELMNSLPKKPDAVNDIKSIDDFINAINPMLVTMMGNFNSFLNAMKDAALQNPKTDKE